MTGYEKYSNAELYESYTTSMDYSGKVAEKLNAEIINRGGIDFLIKKIKEGHIIPDEIKRISMKTVELASASVDLVTIHTMITSDKIPEEQVRVIIRNQYEAFQLHRKNRQITGKTIIGCVTGAVLGIIFSSICCVFAMTEYGEIPHLVIIGLEFINFVIIWLFTKQSRKNTLVFITSFMATFIAYILGLVIFTFAIT